VPLSIILLPAASFMKVQADGMLPSASRGPVQPVSDTLAKSEAAGVMPKSQELDAVSTPSMLEFLLGKPMLFRMMCTLVPVRMMTAVAMVLPSAAKLEASMLYWVPLL
jgi:hypothetical protein